MLVEVKIDDICWRIPFSFFEKNLTAGAKLTKRYSDYPADSGGSRYCELDDTPHFRALNGDDAGYVEYQKAVFKEIFPLRNGEEELKNFKKLAATLDYLKGDYEYGRASSLHSAASKDFLNYIRISKNQEGRYYTVDGDHRLAIMKHRGDKTVLCNYRQAYYRQ